MKRKDENMYLRKEAEEGKNENMYLRKEAEEGKR